MATDCPFCRIARGDAPADLVHASDHVVAFRDANPVAPTHILVVPREHVESASALGEEHAGLLSELFRTATHLARAEGIGRSGWRIVTNVGRDAGQSVYHLHL